MRKLLQFRFGTVTTAAALLLAAGLTAEAQFRAGLQGAITDPTGAAITGAAVSLTNKETNQKRQTTSGAEGFYAFDRLPPGRYSVEVEAPGFKKKVLEEVVVSAEQTEGVNIALELGAVTETVTVSDTVTTLLQTENASIDGTITNEQVDRLPQVGRDPYELVRLAPGVFGLGARNGSGDSVAFPNSSGPGGSNSSIFQTENQVPISANGQRITANGYEIDGVSVNSQAWGGAAVVTPNQESVKEIRVVSSSYSAEYGRNTGALVQVVSQNGTNDFHGSFFGKFNRPELNAFNRWGGPHGESPRRVERDFNQWGGSIGGPIFRDKLFFFFSYETLRQDSNNIETRWIETPEFVNLLKTARPNGIATQITSFPGMEQRVTNVLSRDCASVNLTSANCRAFPGGLDIGSPTGSLGQTVSSGIGGGLDNVPDLRFAEIRSPFSSTAQQFNTRIDWQATQADRVALSLYLVPNDTRFSVSGRPAQDFLSARRTTAGALLWTRPFTPTLVNEARFNVTRWYFNEIESNDRMPWGIPNVRVADNPFPFSLDWGPGGAGVFYQTTYNFRDILTKVISSHNIKFGGEVAREQNNDTVAWAARPSYNFGSLWNFANDAPLDESGFFDPRNGFPTDLKKYIRTGIYSLFVQDDWKVRPDLTLNLGLRWEYFTPLREKFGNLSNVILGTGSNPLTGARIRVGGDASERDRNNFGPQIGFAWSPKNVLGWEAENRAVLRGGFGIGFNRIPQSVTLNGRLNPPFFGEYNLRGNNIVYSLGNNITSFYGWPRNPATIAQFDPNTNLPLTGAAPNVFGLPQDLRTPYTMRYSLDLQYEIAGNWLASVGYQGSQGRKFPRVVNYSLWFPQNPNLNIVRFMRTDVNSNFNALLARLQRRFAQSFELNAQYRFGKSLDFCSNDDNCAQSYPFDQSTEYGPSDFDVTHSFVLSGLWDLPIFRNRQDWTGRLLGGWSLNGIVTASSGFPWTPVWRGENCAVTVSGGGLCPLRPVDYLGGAGDSHDDDTFKTGGNFPGGGLRYFVPPPGGVQLVPPRPGVGRNVFRGPRYFVVDMSAVKRIGLPNLPFLGEGAGVDLRANAFNVFNQLNLRPFLFDSPSTQINNADFGRATEALAGRVIEFQARFNF